MKANYYILTLLLSLVFFLNTAMIQPIPSTLTTPTLVKTKESKKKKVKKRFFKKIIKKIKNVIDGPTLVWAIAGIILGALAIYYFFTLSFFAGIIAIVIVTFGLYQLFKYFQY